MILFYNVYITDTPANYGTATTFDRGNIQKFSNFDITRYSISSLATCHDWSKAIINIELDENIYTEKDWEIMEHHIRSEFICDVIISDKRITRQNQWKEVYTEFDEDLIFYSGNNDHIWIDSDKKHLDELIKRAENSNSKYCTISTSHWMENIRWAKSGYIELNEITPRKLNSNYKIEENCLSHTGINIDSLNIISKDLYYDWIFTCDWGGIDIRRTDGISSLGGESILTIRNRNGMTLPEQEIITPLKEQFRHFDGYMHQRIGNNICPVLSIPDGFFTSEIKIRYGYDDYKDGWVNLNPMKPYYAYDKNGADDRILFADIPLLWNNRIIDYDINPEVNEEEMIQHRLHSILSMMYYDDRYTPYIEKQVEQKVLQKYLKSYKNYNLS
tara:strand:- start:251 stop:1411 length:1161 start_codon:yes stop_codon:yes gene_type:complete